LPAGRAPEHGRKPADEAGDDDRPERPSLLSGQPGPSGSGDEPRLRSCRRCQSAIADAETTAATTPGPTMCAANEPGESPARPMTTRFVGLPCGTATEDAFATTTTPRKSGANGARKR